MYREKHQEMVVEGEHQDLNNVLVLGLSVLGLAVSLYLTYIYLTGSKALCEGIGGCEYVATSSFARVMGIPLPLLGVAGYIAIGAVTLLRRGRSDLTFVLLPVTFGMALIGFFYSAFLTYVEFFVLYAICPWCVASAVCMTLIFAVTAKEVLTGRAAG